MGAISQALLMRVVLDLTVWAVVVRPAWADWFLHCLVYGVSLHSFGPEVCFDKM